MLLGGKPQSPVEISALILRQLKADAEQALGQAVTHAVITVPAYFSDRQREATKKAGEQAGLQVLGILDEPSAAALAFGAGREDEKHLVLVFDLGGGTFDISIIRMVKGQYEQVKLEGDNWLGGDDFDRKIVERLIGCVKVEHDVDPSQNKAFLAKAKQKAEEAKIRLSTEESVDIFLPLVRLDQLLRPFDIKMTLTRQQFEEDIRPLVERTVELVKTALRKVSREPRQITEVLLVGGSTRVPLVRAAVADVFGAEKIRDHVNPMECVALGAAIHAGSLRLPEDPAPPDAPRPAYLHQRTARALGIQAARGTNEEAFVVIIPENTPYPLQKPMWQTFYPREENQSLIRINVYEGSHEMASLNEHQGVVEFKIPEGISATTPVEVGLNYDTDRVVTVEAAPGGPQPGAVSREGQTSRPGGGHHPEG